MIRNENDNTEKIKFDCQFESELYKKALNARIRIVSIIVLIQRCSNTLTIFNHCHLVAIIDKKKIISHTTVIIAIKKIEEKTMLSFIFYNFLSC